jgi:uncharacterized protein (DUF2147 family)
MKKIILTLLSCCSVLYANASVAGYWQTIDDETGKPKSVVRVYEKDNLLFGEIVFTYNERGVANVKDNKCDASVKADNMPGAPAYCGLVIIKNMAPAKDGKYKGGTITDPKKNKTYNAEMWLENGNLIVRGKIAFLGRNQTWKPFSGEDLEALISL